MKHGVWVFSGGSQYIRLWCGIDVDGEWSKSVYEHGGEAIAYAKLDVTGRWMIGARKFGTVTMVWQDCCEGGGVTQEYKAKRRATAMAKRILKGFK